MAELVLRAWQTYMESCAMRTGMGFGQFIQWSESGSVSESHKELVQNPDSVKHLESMSFITV